MFPFFLVYLGTTRAFYIECHPLGCKPNLTKLTPTLLGLQCLVEWYICIGIIFTKMCICQIKFSAWFESLISLKVQPRVWPYKANFLHKLCYAGFKHHDFLKIFIGQIECLKLVQQKLRLCGDTCSEYSLIEAWRRSMFRALDTDIDRIIFLESWMGMSSQLFKSLSTRSWEQRMTIKALFNIYHGQINRIWARSKLNGWSSVTGFG